MATLFNGWIGYGTAIQTGSLQEPSDTGYLRRPFVLGDVDNGIVSDVGSGTAGPAIGAWGTISFAGIFDAQTGGNMLLWFPLIMPIIVQPGCTITTGPGANCFRFPDLRTDSHRTFVWPSGAIVAQTMDGRVLTAGVTLQVTGGQLAAQVPSFGSTVTMATLPTAQAATGSGQLWNNGGIISVS